jgi:hypothetical protein
MRRYHHIGIPTATPRDGEQYLEEYGMCVSGYEQSDYGVEWMRFEPDSPLPELVKTVPHVAFEVDDLRAELAGREVPSWRTALRSNSCSARPDGVSTLWLPCYLAVVPGFPRYP